MGSNENSRNFVPGFHLIARIAGDARIAQICDQRSLRRNGNCPVQFASDRCVANDRCVGSENFLSLRSQRSLRQREADRA